MTPSDEQVKQVNLARLRSIREDYRVLGLQLLHLRERRDALVLNLVGDGVTWREVAEAAGFENPYIAELKRRASEKEDDDYLAFDEEYGYGGAPR